MLRRARWPGCPPEPEKPAPGVICPYEQVPDGEYVSQKSFNIDDTDFRPGQVFRASGLSNDPRWQALLKRGDIVPRSQATPIQKRQPTNKRDVLLAQEAELWELDREFYRLKAESESLKAEKARLKSETDKLLAKGESTMDLITKSGAQAKLEQYLIAKRAPNEQLADTMLRLARAGDEVLEAAYQLSAVAAPDRPVAKGIKKSGAAQTIEAYCEVRKSEGETAAECMARLITAGDPGISALYDTYENSKDDRTMDPEDEDEEADDETDAEKKLRKLAQQVTKAAGLSHEEAYLKALTEHPDLYEEYCRERKRAL